MIFGIGCSFATTNYGVAMPKGKTIIHATLDPADLNKDIPAEHALIGDAGLTLEALLAEVQGPAQGQAARPRGRRSPQEIKPRSRASGWRSGCRKLTAERRRRSRPTA